MKLSQYFLQQLAQYLNHHGDSDGEYPLQQLRCLAQDDPPEDRRALEIFRELLPQQEQWALLHEFLLLPASQKDLMEQLILIANGITDPEELDERVLFLITD